MDLQPYRQNLTPTLLASKQQVDNRWATNLTHNKTQEFVYAISKTLYFFSKMSKIISIIFVPI